MEGKLDTFHRAVIETHVCLVVRVGEFLTCEIKIRSSRRDELCVDITNLAKEVYGILVAPPLPAHRTPEKQRTKKSQFFLNSSNKKAKCVTLHIQGLDSVVSPHYTV